MATIKSFTDISQSKKLAEILPLESADMEYLSIKENGLLIGDVPFVKDDSEVENSVYSHIYDRIACWSLAALLGVLPESYQLTSNKEGKVQLMLIHHLEKDYYDNPIDACYEMILKLHELNLL